MIQRHVLDRGFNFRIRQAAPCSLVIFLALLETDAV